MSTIFSKFKLPPFMSQLDSSQAFYGIQNGLYLSHQKKIEQIYRDGEHYWTVGFEQTAQISTIVDQVNRIREEMGYKALSPGIGVLITVLPIASGWIMDQKTRIEKYNTQLESQNQQPLPSIFDRYPNIVRAAAFMQNQTGNLCQLASVVNCLVLLYLGQTTYASFALTMITMGFLDRHYFFNKEISKGVETALRTLTFHQFDENKYFNAMIKQWKSTNNSLAQTTSSYWNTYGEIVMLATSVGVGNWRAKLTVGLELINKVLGDYLANMISDRIDSTMSKSRTTEGLSFENFTDLLTNPNPHWVPNENHLHYKTQLPKLTQPVNLEDLLVAFEETIHACKDDSTTRNTLFTKLQRDPKFQTTEKEQAGKIEDYISVLRQRLENIVHRVQNKELFAGDSTTQQKMENMLGWIITWINKMEDPLQKADILFQIGLEAGNVCDTGVQTVIELIYNGLAQDANLSRCPNPLDLDQLLVAFDQLLPSIEKFQQKRAEIVSAKPNRRMSKSIFLLKGKSRDSMAPYISAFNKENPLRQITFEEIQSFSEIFLRMRDLNATDVTILSFFQSYENEQRLKQEIFSLLTEYRDEKALTFDVSAYTEELANAIARKQNLPDWTNDLDVWVQAKHSKLMSFFDYFSNLTLNKDKIKKEVQFLLSQYQTQTNENFALEQYADELANAIVFNQDLPEWTQELSRWIESQKTPLTKVIERVRYFDRIQDTELVYRFEWILDKLFHQDTPQEVKLSMLFELTNTHNEIEIDQTIRSLHRLRIQGLRVASLKDRVHDALLQKRLGIFSQFYLTILHNTFISDIIQFSADPESPHTFNAVVDSFGPMFGIFDQDAAKADITVKKNLFGKIFFVVLGKLISGAFSKGISIPVAIKDEQVKMYEYFALIPFVLKEITYLNKLMGGLAKWETLPAYSVDTIVETMQEMTNPRPIYITTRVPLMTQIQRRLEQDDPDVSWQIVERMITERKFQELKEQKWITEEEFDLLDEHGKDYVVETMHQEAKHQTIQNAEIKQWFSSWIDQQIQSLLEGLNTESKAFVEGKLEEAGYALAANQSTDDIYAEIRTKLPARAIEKLKQLVSWKIKYIYGHEMHEGNDKQNRLKDIFLKAMLFDMNVLSVRDLSAPSILNEATSSLAQSKLPIQLRSGLSSQEKQRLQQCTGQMNLAQFNRYPKSRSQIAMETRWKDVAPFPKTRFARLKKEAKTQVSIFLSFLAGYILYALYKIATKIPGIKKIAGLTDQKFSLDISLRYRDRWEDNISNWLISFARLEQPAQQRVLNILNRDATGEDLKIFLENIRGTTPEELRWQVQAFIEDLEINHPNAVNQEKTRLAYVLGVGEDGLQKYIEEKIYPLLLYRSLELATDTWSSLFNTTGQTALKKGEAFIHQLSDEDTEILYDHYRGIKTGEPILDSHDEYLQTEEDNTYTRMQFLVNIQKLQLGYQSEVDRFYGT